MGECWAPKGRSGWGEYLFLKRTPALLADGMSRSSNHILVLTQAGILGRRVGYKLQKRDTSQNRKKRVDITNDMPAVLRFVSISQGRKKNAGLGDLERGRL